MKSLLLAAALFAVPAFAAELEGVKADDSITVEGKTLALNGQGLRVKIFFKVYVASLWLEHASKDPAAILKADEVRRVEMSMLRDLDKKAIGDAIKDGFEKNVSDLKPLQDRINGLVDALIDVKKGSSLVITYVPGVGTTVDGGKQRYTAPGKDFADGLFSVWLGAKPVDEGLKKGMLGNK